MRSKSIILNKMTSQRGNKKLVTH